MINYTYLRQQKAAVLKEWHEKAVCEKKPAVQHYDNATILPLNRMKGDNLLFGRGGVVDEDGNYVDESAIDRRVQYAYEFSAPIRRDKKVVYCGYLVNQWGHFLVEAVARLWYFLENDETIDSYVFFVEYGKERGVVGNYREFFELLGVWEKIEVINQPTKYTEILIPELGYRWRSSYSDKFKRLFRKVTENALARMGDTGEKNQKIYFSRSLLSGIEEREFGLDLLDDYFQKNGYRVLHPEKIHLTEVVVAIERAEEIATLSGSLPHNLLFAEDGKKAVIIERNVLNNEIQVDINCMKSLNVTYVDANIPLYSINLGWGPFIMAYNDQLRAFSEERGYCEPDRKYMTEKYKKKSLAGYMKAYKKEYHYQWFMEEWSIRYTNYLREGYDAGFLYYQDYLLGIKPFMLSHYFDVHYWKQMVKRIIGSFR